MIDGISVATSQSPLDCPTEFFGTRPGRVGRWQTGAMDIRLSRAFRAGIDRQGEIPSPEKENRAAPGVDGLDGLPASITALMPECELSRAIGADLSKAI